MATGQPLQRERAIEQWTIRSLLSVSLFQSISGEELNFVEKGTQFFLWDQFEVGFRFVCNKKVRKVIADHRAVVVS